MQGNRLINYAMGLALFSLTTIAYGQTCNPEVAMTAPDIRFQDNGDGTVSDLHTDLMWQRCSAGRSGSDCAAGSSTTFTWDLALQHPQTLNSSGGFAGYGDWRLPNSKELQSLVEEACYLPAINMTHFPNTLSSYYWSSSPLASGSSHAWLVGFYHGDAHYLVRSSGSHVRLVRSGQ